MAGEPEREVEAVGEKEGEGANDSAMLPEITSLRSEVGYDINQGTVKSSGLPPLIYAVLKNHAPSVRLLLAAPGIDVNRPDSTHGQTSLYLAACNGREACI